MMGITVFILFCMISRGLGYRRPEICSGIDISREKDIQLKDFVGLWYTHLLVDDTNNTASFDKKVLFELTNTRSSLKSTDFGRSTETGKCETKVLILTEKIRNRPCVLSEQIEPAIPREIETIILFLNEEKTQAISYNCLDFDNKRNKCNAVLFTGSTKNKYLRNGEKEVFEKKIREFGIKIPPRGLPLQNPTSNKCEEEFFRRQRLQRRKYRPRKVYRY